MTEREFPILEYDDDRNAFIRPLNIIQPVEIAERCVLCFFAEAIEKVLKEYIYRIAAHFRAESLILPLYELDYKGQKISLIQAGVGAPIAGAQIDELTAFGCKKYIACGSCGVLQKEIAVGHLIIPVSAVRDEGTSYHYVKPSREINADERVVRVIENVLTERKVPYVKAKTWTTDAFYRETPLKIQQRKKEGCVAVEMEASAYMAVSQYNNVEFGQILYAGDSLGSDTWDSREHISRTEIREFVLRLALDACSRL
ncbi:MAG: Purine nucleoside phosphorylase DeoD-type [Firmicutes bacterium ADurb.Bin182]|nr:MAG: Purine nucleoside phosphorylase DeoD-type [Firmicutes bacterium ADurb.Bin182]